MPKVDENMQQPLDNKVIEKLIQFASNPPELQRMHARECDIEVPFLQSHYYGHTFVTTLNPEESTKFAAADFRPVTKEHADLFLKDVFPGIYSINVASVSGGAPGSTYKIDVEPRFTSIKTPEKDATLQTNFVKFRAPGSDTAIEGSLFVQGGVGMISDKHGDIKANCNVYGSATVFSNDAHIRFSNVDASGFEPVKPDEIVEVPTGSALVNTMLGRVLQDPMVAEVLKNPLNRPSGKDKIKVKGAAYNTYGHLLKQMLSDELAVVGRDTDYLEVKVEKVAGPDATDADPPLTVSVDVMLTHPDLG